MAFQLNISATLSSNNKAILLEDTTGVYNSSSNPTGWGTPNPLTSDAAEVTITITDPDGTDYVFDSTTTPATMPTFPNTTGTTITIPNTSVGQVAADWIQDGLWYVKYHVLLNNNDEYERTQLFLFHAAANCCVDRLLARIDGCCDECDEAKLKAVTTAFMTLQAAQRAANCAKPNQAQKLLDKVNFICNQQNCSCS